MGKLEREAARQFESGYSQFLTEISFEELIEQGAWKSEAELRGPYSPSPAPVELSPTAGSKTVVESASPLGTIHPTWLTTMSTCVE